MAENTQGSIPIKILVPLDGSERGDEALAYVRMLAEKMNLEVRLLRCFEPPSIVYSLPDLGVNIDGLTDQRLAQLLNASLEEKKSSLQGIPCQASVECIDPATGILDQAEAADMVVMSSHGRGALERWLLGSVTTKVARACSKPVLVVAGPSMAQPRLRTVMVCLDGSKGAEVALREAITLTSALGARLITYRFTPVVYQHREGFPGGRELSPGGRVRPSRADRQVCRSPDRRPAPYRGDGARAGSRPRGSGAQG